MKKDLLRAIKSALILTLAINSLHLPHAKADEPSTSITEVTDFLYSTLAEGVMTYENGLFARGHSSESAAALFLAHHNVFVENDLDLSHPHQNVHWVASDENLYYTIIPCQWGGSEYFINAKKFSENPSTGKFELEMLMKHLLKKGFSDSCNYPGRYFHG